MEPESTKKINLIGIFIWTILYFVLVPFKIIREYPIIVIGYLYTVFIGKHRISERCCAYTRKHFDKCSRCYF